MQRYLLNEVTGVICLEGTSVNDVTVRAEEIEIDGGFQLKGVKEDGTEFTATLTIEEYFDGKEFVIDAPEVATEVVATAEVEVVAPEIAREVIELECDIIDAIKNITTQVIEADSRALKVKTKRDKDILIKDIEALITAIDKDMTEYGERIRVLAKKGADVLELGDRANTLYDHIHTLEEMVNRVLRGSYAPEDKNTANLVFLNID